MLPDGYPPLDRYQDVPGTPLFEEMRAFATRFLESNQHLLKDYSAQWSKDPLHRWSRRWEYPFVTERVGEAMAARGSGSARALDAGSGLTFFAHWLTERNPGLEVEGLDRDPGVESASDGLEAPATDSVSYGTGDLAALPYAAASFAMVSCISVLEHTRNRDAIIREFARVLEPGGVLILTIDISLDDRWEIPRSEAAELLAALDRHFDADGEYDRMLREFDADAMLSTDWVRERDPSLLPWRYPHPSDMLRRFPNVVGMFRPRFKSLTCFCGTWRKPE